MGIESEYSNTDACRQSVILRPMSIQHTEKPQNQTVRYLEVDAESAGQRLDNYLLRILKGVPKSMIYRIIRSGEVRIDKGRAQPATRLEAGNIVRIPPVRVAARPRPDAAPELGWLEKAIIFEDQDMLALNKPSGLAVHGGSGVSLGLIEALRAARPEAPFLELVHRLDRDTSGVLLVAKKRSILRALHEAMRAGDIKKRYFALLRGVWQGGARRVECALQKGVTRAGERIVTVDATLGKMAISRFSPHRTYKSEEAGEGASLVGIELVTGRTHQARVHAAHIDMPIAGDDKYGDKAFNRTLRAFGLRRLFLHASRLDLKHPRSGLKMHIEAPLADDLERVLEYLGDKNK